jgi:transcriptional regulator with XRE-family HTH domain
VSRPLGYTGEQIRAARALARIEQAELAHSAGVSLETIKRLERIRGPVDANTRTLAAISDAFERLNIHFEGGGVTLRPQDRPLDPTRSFAETPTFAAPAQGRIERVIYYSTLQPKLLARLKPTIDTYGVAARKRAQQEGFTGGALFANGRLLGLLEGEEGVVQRVLDGTLADPRHFNVQVLERGLIPRRLFLDWRVYCGAFPSDKDVLGDVTLGSAFRPETLTPEAAVELLIFMRDLQQVPPRSLRGCSGVCQVADQCLDKVCVDSVRAMSSAAPTPTA